MRKLSPKVRANTERRHGTAELGKTRALKPEDGYPGLGWVGRNRHCGTLSHQYAEWRSVHQQRVELDARWRLTLSTRFVTAPAALANADRAAGSQ